MATPEKANLNPSTTPSGTHNARIYHKALVSLKITSTLHLGVLDFSEIDNIYVLYIITVNRLLIPKEKKVRQI
jgi:hypothetical protein